MCEYTYAGFTELYIASTPTASPPTRPLLRMQIKEGVSHRPLITFISYCTHVQS